MDKPPVLIPLEDYRAMTVAEAAVLTHGIPDENRYSLLLLNKAYQAFFERTFNAVFFRSMEIGAMQNVERVLGEHAEALTHGHSDLSVKVAADSRFMEYVERTTGRIYNICHQVYFRVIRRVHHLSDSNLAEALTQPDNLAALFDMDEAAHYAHDFKQTPDEVIAARRMVRVLLNEKSSSPWRMFLLYGNSFSVVARHTKSDQLASSTLGDASPLEKLALLKMQVESQHRKAPRIAFPIIRAGLAKA